MRTRFRDFVCRKCLLTAGTIEILRSVCGRHSVLDGNFRRIKGDLQIGLTSHPLGGINVAGVWPAELKT
mgnify:FL=1